MADLIAGLRAILLADASIEATTDGRVFGGELPDDEAASMPRAAIVLAEAGGTALMADSYVEVETQRVDLFAFGATPAEANALARAAALILRRVRRGIYAGVVIHWVKPGGGALQARERDLEWPFAFQSFQVLHALEAVS